MSNVVVNRMGFWAALASTVFAVIYIVPQLLIGIEMPESKQDLMFILLPSIFLAFSFLIMMVAVHYYAGDDKKIWSHIGIMFALAYFIFVSIVYFTVLTVTLPYTLQEEAEAVALLRYEPKSFMTGIDALGYASMSFATLFTVPVFSKSRLARWTRQAFFANGTIAPIILSTQIYPLMAYAGQPGL